MVEKIELQGATACYRFEEVAQKTVAFIMDSFFDPKVVVYENNKLIHTCKYEFWDHDSVVVDGSKVYFAKRRQEIVELDAETLQDTVVVYGVGLISAAPHQRDFLGVAEDGILQTSESEKNLNQLFARMKGSNWNAVISADSYAVLAGWSEFSMLDGTKLSKRSNYFLLVHLQTLEVVNQSNPLSLEWSQSEGTSVC